MSPKKALNSNNNTANNLQHNGGAATTSATTSADEATSNNTPAATSAIAALLAASSNTAAMQDLATEQKQHVYVANAKLCRLVRKCPWMYDRNNPNYAKKQILDKSWAKIAKDCNDSVASCKERWRNIRAAFARSINIYKTHGGPNRVKPYYLHKELSFLVKPMMEGRDKFKPDLDDAKEELDDEECDEDAEDEVEECEENTEDDEECNDGNSTVKTNDEPVRKVSEGVVEPDAELNSDLETDFHYNEESNHTNNNEALVVANGHKRASDATTSTATVVEENSFKRIKLDSHTARSAAVVAASPDADAKFLEALLPDMRSMNARQKVVFKRKVYQSLEEVFEISTDFPQTSHGCAHKQQTKNACAMAQTIMQSVANLNEAELQKLNVFMQCQLRSSATLPRVSHSAPNSNSVPRPSTAIPRAQQNGRLQPPPATGAATGGKEHTNGASVWEQLVPMTIKTEVDDVEID